MMMTSVTRAPRRVMLKSWCTFGTTLLLLENVRYGSQPTASVCRSFEKGSSNFGVQVVRGQLQRLGPTIICRLVSRELSYVLDSSADELCYYS
jgi:hypothetical protein